MTNTIQYYTIFIHNIHSPYSIIYAYLPDTLTIDKKSVNLD